MLAVLQTRMIDCCGASMIALMHFLFDGTFLNSDNCQFAVTIFFCNRRHFCRHELGLNLADG